MTPHYTRKGGRLYRYYVSTDAIRGRNVIGSAPSRLATDTVDSAVLAEIRRSLRTPEIVAQAVAAARRDSPNIPERDLIAALDQFDELWAALFPAEQARIVRLLVARVTVSADGLAVDLRQEGVGTVIRDMLNPASKEAAE